MEHVLLRITRIKSFVLNESRLFSARADPIREAGEENLPLLTPDTFTEAHVEASQHAHKGLGWSSEPGQPLPAAFRRRRRGSLLTYGLIFLHPHNL